MPLTEMTCGVNYTTNLLKDNVNELINLSGSTLQKSLKLKMTAARYPVVMLLQGDSTGNEEDEWFYLLAKKIGEKYQSHNVVQYLWSIPNDSFLPSTRLQTGGLGDGYVYLDSSLDASGLVLDQSGNMDTPDGIDVRVKFNMDTYSGIGEGLIVSKFGISGNRSWAIGVYSSGLPYFWWSSDGTTLSGPTTATSPLNSAGSDILLRVTLDGVAGELSFYTSNDDGDTWQQLGGVVSVGVTSIFNSTADLTINGRGTSQWSGRFYRAEISDINGKMVASPSACLYRLTEEYSTFKDSQGNTCSFNAATGDYQGSPTLVMLNCSASGQSLGYSLNVARFAKQTPMRTDISFVSYSHNEGGTSNYYDLYPTFLDWHKNKYKNSVMAISTQNPKKSPSSLEAISEHEYRCGLIAQIAASGGHYLIDAFGAFVKAENTDSLIDSDGIHPTPEGSELWALTASRVILI